MPAPMPEQGAPGAGGQAPQSPQQAQGSQQGAPSVPPAQAIEGIHTLMTGLAPAIKQSGDAGLVQAFGLFQSSFMQFVQEAGKPAQGQGGPAPGGRPSSGPMPQNASQGSQPAPQY